MNYLLSYQLLLILLYYYFTVIFRCFNVLSFLFNADTRLHQDLQTTSSSGSFQMGISSRICRGTTPSLTRSRWTRMEFWFLEVRTCLELFAIVAEIKSLLKSFLCSFTPLAADNGTIHLWDWRTGYNFQRIHAAVQPGSLDSESGIFSCVFDHSESRLITAEADKTIKVYKEDDMAVRTRLIYQKNTLIIMNILHKDHWFI